jgi:hypothetical protein
MDQQCANVVRDWAGRIRCPLFRLAPDPPGSSRAVLLNRAVRDAAGDHLIFIEGDCLLHRRFIADHILHATPGTFVQGRRAGVRSRYVRRISSRRFHPLIWFLRRRVYGLKQGIRRPWPAVRLNDLRTIHACNFSVWREDLARVNGFDERFDENGDELLELAVRLSNAGLTLRTVTGHAIVYHLDHRPIVKYGSLRSVKILEETKREHRVRCQRGLVVLPDSESLGNGASPEPNLELSEAEPTADGHPAQRLKSVQSTASHFRDKIVPRSMLARIVHRSR